MQDNNLEWIKFQKETLINIYSEDIFVIHYISKWIDFIEKYHADFEKFKLDSIKDQQNQ